MSTTTYRAAPARISSYHGAKKNLVGNQGVPPAWRAQPPPHAGQAQHGRRVAGAPQPRGSFSSGSKVLISNLPKDVQPREVEELFTKTIGPLSDVFVVYNSQGNSKGMAVAAFVRPGDAALARAKYNEKIVDGRTPLRIEIVVDSDTLVAAPTPAVRTGGAPPTSAQAPASAEPQTLLSRLAKTPQQATPSIFDRVGISKTTKAPPKVTKGPKPTITQKTSAPAPPVANNKKLRSKKGPKRIRKLAASGNPAAPVKPTKRTAAQLDQDMDDYRADVDPPTVKMDDLIMGSA